MQRGEQNDHRRAGEVHSVFLAGRTLHKTISTAVPITQRLPSPLQHLVLLSCQLVKEKHKVILEQQENHFRSYQPREREEGRPVQNNLDIYQTTQRLLAGGEPPSVLQAREDPVQSNQQDSGVPKKKEAEKIEFE